MPEQENTQKRSYRGALYLHAAKTIVATMVVAILGFLGAWLVGIPAAIQDYKQTAKLHEQLQKAVIAFDRTADEGACPADWERFVPVGGRFIVGAGQHENSDMNGVVLSKHAAHAENPSDAVGGAEVHPLTVEEMPSHVHEVVSGIRGGSNAAAQAPGGNSDTSLPKGKKNGNPHNNMPPFVALYFCKPKEN